MADTVHWSDLQFLLEPSCLVLIGTAAGVVLLSAVRALEYELTLSRMGIHHEEASLTLDGQQALLLPVAASCSLLAFFYLFSSIQHLLLLLVSLSSVAAVAFALHPVLSAAAGRSDRSGRWLQMPVSVCGWLTTTLDQVLLGLVGVVAVLWWLVTGSWLISNLLGICLCMAFISFIRLPNIKVCTLLLGGLFVYDIFWVFISEMFFGDNVMVAAASKQADNPVHIAVEALHMPVPSLVARQLELPMKLLFPRDLLHPSSQDSLILGLGDMALPGMLFSLLLNSDYRRAAKRQLPGAWSLGPDGGLLLLRSGNFWPGCYSSVCWAGYCVGLVLALGAGVLFQAAQPALLYLVPCTLVPVAMRASARGEWGELWSGQRMQLPPGKQEEPDEDV